jgi:hypothetical protein
MDSLFDTLPDIDWTCTMYEGAVLLVLETTGPAMSAALLTRPVPTVKLRFTYDPTSLPDLRPTAFLCYVDNPMEPLLVVDPPDASLIPLMKTVEQGSAWVLIFQAMSDDKPVSRIFTVQHEIAEEIPELLPRWIVGHAN